MLHRNSRMVFVSLFGLVIGNSVVAVLRAQDSSGPQASSESAKVSGNKAYFTASNWCADSGTACWVGGDKRSYLNGLRLLADLDLSFAYQGGDNKFENTLRGMPKIAVETNVVGGWVAIQGGLLPPGTVQLDERSPAIESLREELRQERRVHVSSGVVAGLSFLDGALAAGWGLLRYDRRDFASKTPLRGSVFRDSFWYVALQPISGIRSAFKRNKDGGSAESTTNTTSGATPPRN